MKNAGTSITTWSNGTQNQSTPAYSGVQEVYSSTSWVYLRSSGLGSHTMGPWLNGNFPNLPVNKKVLYRIPRSPTVPGTKTQTGGGAIGYFVDGVAMFDSRDAFYWNGTADTQGSGYWNRDAYVNESQTFDPAYAHQPGDGSYHYHASPVALRYLLGDHVDFNASTKTYSESTNAVTAHSPLLGWVRDGWPVYGPYGYSSASNSASGVRRMVSGYVQRNGQNGTQNLTTTGRTGLPLWAQRLYNVSSNVLAGPTVGTSYPLGRYMEDNDYLGDLGRVQGVDFDLDEYNGRWCYTPEFPGGTYAYFVCISSNGTPTFPYNIGRAFYGAPSGAAVTNITESVVTNILAGPNTPLTLNPPGTTSSNYNVTLVWTSVEGGTYQVASSTDSVNFTTAINSIAAQGVNTATNYTGVSGLQYARVQRTALATYDAVGSTAATSQSATQSFTITPATAPGTNAIAAQSGAYGTAFSFTFATNAFTGLNSPVSYTASGMPTGISFTSGTRTFSGTPTQIGSFTVSIIATDSGTPVGTLTNSFSLTVNKAALTVTADNFTRATGVANPTFTASYAGFVNGENLGSSGVTGSPSLTTTATSGSAAGNYIITCATGSLASANYTFSFVNGTLTVTNAAIVSASTARNILLIIADDYGIDSASLFNTNAGASLPPTPNINALKNSGVLFRNAYSHPTCSPTRATMLTGRHPFRTGITTAVTQADGQLTAGEFTLPEAFAANSQLGYSVAAFGKWHLTVGVNSANDPNTIGGWPHYAGCLSGALANYTNWTKTVNGVTTSNVTTYATTDVANDSTAWIQARGTNPWFAWVAFNAPHTPFHKPPASLCPSYNLTGLPVNSNQRTHYEAAVEALDTEIGRLLQSVNLTNTTVIFIGDNGTPQQVIQAPYTTNHAKDSIYEGGVRVPLIIAGAGVTNQNRESTALVHAADLYSTILELAGVNVAATQPASLTLDSRSLLPILTNGPDGVRYGYAEQSGSTLAASESGKSARNAAGYRLIQFNDNHAELYNVLTDANEQTNLLASALSAEAQANYDALQTQLATYVVLTPGTSAIPAQGGTYGGAFSFTFATNAFTGLATPVSYAASGMPNGISFTSGTRTFSGTPTQIGAFTVSIIATDSSIPAVSLTNSFSLTVSQAVLTVTADNFSRAAGLANPTFTASYAGFMNGENFGSSGVTGTPSLTTTATSGSAAGSYTITCAAGSLASANYAFSFVNGTLTVTNVVVVPPVGDPQLTSWFTNNSGLYARIYTTDANRTNGIAQTTWTNTNGQLRQSVPAYRGVQEIYSSSGWVYFRTTGFGQQIMGPWYDTAARTIQFINLPTNQHQVFRIPRTATLAAPPTVKTPTFGPEDKIGYFVDGVAMYDALDGYQWNGTTEAQGGNFQWRRAAYANEYITFDPGNSHQQNLGTYHNHANPIALRYLLGDHVSFNAATKIYTESTNAPTRHSPIVGWVRDGLPIYGPYGYANATNAGSGIRRMVSGHQLRNGSNGSDNLSATGRGTLPAWMLRNNGNTAQTGPAVNATYPLGRYLQDYAYLGDLTNSATGQKYQLGVDFDLNEFGCRFCVTPEFPTGTYAYFIPIDSAGTPVAPWNVGMYFFGNATGGKWTNIVETVATNFLGGPNTPLTLNSPVATAATSSNYNVTLVWSSVEGGHYVIQNTEDFSSWMATGSSTTATNTQTQRVINTSTTKGFFRVQLDSVDTYDSALTP